MVNPRILGLFTLVPTAMLLTVSFFVLVVLRKIEEKGIRAFGYVVAGILWLVALVTFSAGIYILSTGKHFGICMKPGMMQFSQPQMMHSGVMQGMMSEQKPMLPCGKMNMPHGMDQAPEDMKK